ncbi:MAG: response regulator receiver modulated diguanylate cyclase [Candidatus Magnetoglobus multicellularis str. Araruama]|uniref:diguanylate cyclase n=1 Tax=Candidatus Magnetoglobus multicellularis str. Araruama TaxID=890399 RepID=A0A1V1NY37_9BACT|nr:MAG: response regulator receiver modulated diguanylate cyclase [Candidatus Magnetoglobus multicellularis str. Araruama]
MNQNKPNLWNKSTILIVDDNPLNIHVLAQTLFKEYDVKIATDGPSALTILDQDNKIDLILLDIMMPEMDGYEVCRRIKNKPSTRDIPVIFVSAKGEVEDQQHGFNLGAVDYITKPFDIPLVQARINVHLRLKNKSEKLEKLALLDALTDIPNRRSLDDSVEREFKRGKRDKKTISLLMIDVDHFKAFNDHYGHGAGDICLKKIAQTLESCIKRPGDMVGRYGGEEFMVVLPDCIHSGAVTIAEEMRQKIEMLNIPHKYSSVADHVTVSIGVKSKLCESEITSQEMMNDADQMLYLAKEQGRNRVVSENS